LKAIELHKHVYEGTYYLEVITRAKKPYRISASFRPCPYIPSDLQPRQSQMVNFEVGRQQLIRFANRILFAIYARKKYEEWKPTFQAFQKKIEEEYGKRGVYGWLIDWLRLPENNKIAKELYEWLQEAERLGFFR